MLRTRKTIALTFLTLALPSLGFAATDDNIIWKTAITAARVWNLKANELYVGLGAPIESISSSTDRDYIVVMCQGANVERVGISYKAKSGDLDVKVYDLAGKYLGASATKNDTDSLDIKSKSLKAVVLEVYGYNGATNGYDFVVTCQVLPNPRAVAAAAAAVGAVSR